MIFSSPPKTDPSFVPSFSQKKNLAHGSVRLVGCNKLAFVDRYVVGSAQNVGLSTLTDDEFGSVKADFRD